jgi:hypothetical protein
MKNTEIIKRFSPEDYFLAIMFGRSRSPSYHTAVKIAQSSAGYYESGEGTAINHLATYVNAYESIAAANALFDVVCSWKNVQVFSKGRLIQSNWKIGVVLRCMSEALRCTDWRAHCQKLISDPFEPYGHRSWSGGLTISLDTSEESRKKEKKPPLFVTRWLLPCTHIEAYFRPQQGHPSTPQDQLQATAVREGSDWCPLFRPEDLKELLLKSNL